LLEAIRAYNHSVVEALDNIERIEGHSVLDVGASPHGYALEHALALGIRRYVGIGLDVDAPLLVRGPSGIGEVQKQDAEALDFDDETFDLIVSMSTFEHVAHVDRVLIEMRRVLKPGGKALVTFEPIWTCSYGHHLHHFGDVSALVPDWAHLLWSKEEMLQHLADVWPHDAPLTLAGAAEWVYDGSAINRIGIVEMRHFFRRGPLKVDWIMPLMDAPRDRARCKFVAQQLGLNPDDLMTKGLSVLLTRSPVPVHAA
jgi:SAM-dependent methyltransferase